MVSESIPHMDLLKLLHGFVLFVKVVLCIYRPLAIFLRSFKMMVSASIQVGTKVPSLCDLFVLSGETLTVCLITTIRIS